MAARGMETLWPHEAGRPDQISCTKHQPKAVVHCVRLMLGTLYNMVGFQTKLRHGAQIKLLNHPRPRKRRFRDWGDYTGIRSLTVRNLTPISN